MAEPRSTSTCRMVKVSQLYCATSRDAVEVEIAEGRSPEVMLSPMPGPPSPALKERPATLQGTSFKVSAFCPDPNSLTTVSAWGTSLETGQLADAGDAALIAFALVDAFILNGDQGQPAFGGGRRQQGRQQQAAPKNGKDGTGVPDGWILLFHQKLLQLLGAGWRKMAGLWVGENGQSGGEGSVTSRYGSVPPGQWSTPSERPRVGRTCGRHGVGPRAAGDWRAAAARSFAETGSSMSSCSQRSPSASAHRDVVGFGLMGAELALGSSTLTA